MDKEPGESRGKVLIEGVDYFLPDEENPWEKARRIKAEKHTGSTLIPEKVKQFPPRRPRFHPMDSTMFENKRGNIRAKQER